MTRHAWHARALVLTAGLMLCHCSRAPHTAPPAPPAPPETLLVEAQGTSPEEKLALCILQGIANRSGPRVFLHFGTDNRWNRWDFDSGRTNGVGPIWDEEAATRVGSRYRSIEDAWIGILRDRGHRFRTVTPSAALEALRGEWKGWLLYERLASDLAPAATWAGLEDALPVTPALRAAWDSPQAPAPVVADYRSVRASFPPGTDPRLAGHDWLARQLLPRCARDGAVSRDRTYGLDIHDTLVDADQAAQNRWVLYDLSHDSTAARMPEVKADPPDKPLLDRILGHLEPLRFVYGWGRRNESAFIRGLNRNRALGMVAGIPNASFFARLPDPGAPLRQRTPHADTRSVQLEDKVYVAFLVNEGDTLKTAGTFLGFGSWLQPERGSLPLNWGMMPNLARTHPWLLRYYYDTMGSNDYFFAAPSGWGYAHPGYLPPDQLEPYARLVREGLALGDLRYLNVWWTGELKQRNQWLPFLRATGARGHVAWGDRQSVEFHPDGPIEITSHHFYTYKVPAADFARRLREETRDVEAPWFVVVYGAFDHGTPHRFAELARHLPPDRFKIVRLDEFFAAAELARDRVTGRILRPAPGSLQGTAP